MQSIYGVLDKNDCHIDISTSLKGTKRVATRDGYDKVSIRYNGGYNVSIVAVKVNNKWVDYKTYLAKQND